MIGERREDERRRRGGIEGLNIVIGRFEGDGGFEIAVNEAPVRYNLHCLCGVIFAVKIFR